MTLTMNTRMFVYIENLLNFPFVYFLKTNYNEIIKKKENLRITTMVN